MTDSNVCHECKMKIDWSSLPVDYFAVIGYKSWIYNCTCGHTQSRHNPFSKDKKSLWDGLRGMLDDMFPKDSL